ncbi:hypothetical protein GJ496_011256 [Pomphorhynchus laevis]|nr:hypothetical protein GJ496_011256 [Pomphorhynchus laevis]
MLINTFIHEFDAEVENQNKLQVDQQNEQQVDFEAIKNHLEGQVENQDEHKIEQLHKSDKVCDGDNQKEIIKKESNNIDVKARSTALSEQEEDLKRFDVVSMINTLLDEEPTESSRKVSERPRSTRQFIGISDAPRPNNRIFRNTMLSVNENYHFNTEQISRPNFEYRNYRPPSQVKVQINCNGQPTVTSTSLQDFRRLIGLKDYPRKNYNHGQRRASRAYDYRNGYNDDIPRVQSDCATRFAYRFGRSICDELKQCLLNLRKISENREQCETWIALRPWMPRNIGHCGMNTPTESCCMIDWLVFEFLKEYCHTNGVIKCLDQVWGPVTQDVAMKIMKEWFEHIRIVDRHRRNGFCDCASQRLSVLPDKALQLLRNLNIVTMNVDQFLSKMLEMLKPELHQQQPGISQYQRKIN